MVAADGHAESTTVDHAEVVPEDVNTSVCEMEDEQTVIDVQVRNHEMMSFE